MKSESPSERMLKFAEHYDGFFSLDASDLRILANQPSTADVNGYIQQAHLGIDREGELADVYTMLEGFKKEYEEFIAKKEADIDYELARFLKRIEAFRVEKRLAESELAAQIKAGSSTIGQLSTD